MEEEEDEIEEVVCACVIYMSLSRGNSIQIVGIS